MPSSFARGKVRQSPRQEDHPMEIDRRDFLKLSSALTFTLAAGGCATGAGAPTATSTGRLVEVHWLGQAATKLTSPTGKVIVIDPFIRNNPKTPEGWKDLDKLGKVDVILVTHGHGDHTGDVSELQKRTGAPVCG